MTRSIMSKWFLLAFLGLTGLGLTGLALAGTEIGRAHV